MNFDFDAPQAGDFGSNGGKSLPPHIILNYKSGKIPAKYLTAEKDGLSESLELGTYGFQYNPKTNEGEFILDANGKRVIAPYNDQPTFAILGSYWQGEPVFGAEPRLTTNKILVLKTDPITVYNKKDRVETGFWPDLKSKYDGIFKMHLYVVAYDLKNSCLLAIKSGATFNNALCKAAISTSGGLATPQSIKDFYIFNILSPKDNLFFAFQNTEFAILDKEGFEASATPSGDYFVSPVFNCGVVKEGHAKFSILQENKALFFEYFKNRKSESPVAAAVESQSSTVHNEDPLDLPF